MVELVSATDVRIQGDLAGRLALSYERLHAEAYAPEETLGPGRDVAWPGEYVGRAMIGQVLAARAVGRDPVYLPAVVHRLSERIGRRGFMGPEDDPDHVNEQQLAGHGWLLRGLAEWHAFSGDPRALDLIARIAGRLLLRTEGRWYGYPTGASERPRRSGLADSTVVGDVPGWRLSPEAGAAFAVLHGTAQVARLVDLPSLLDLIEEIGGRFLTLDPVALRMQTQLFMAALRGLVHCGEIGAPSEVIEAATSRYHLWRDQAMSESFGSAHAFGEWTWADACPTSDALALALALWRHTGDAEFLEDAHLIYHNGLGHAQRPGGGFGCDTCPGPQGLILAPHTYEAPWCCTMRGPEGLARAAESAVCLDGDAVTYPLLLDHDADVAPADAPCSLSLRTGYPHEGRVEVRVVKAARRAPRRLRFFAPSWTHRWHATVAGAETPCERGRDGFVEVAAPLGAGDAVEVTFALETGPEAALRQYHHRHYHTFRHGPLVLGCEHPREALIGWEDELTPLHKDRFEVRPMGLVLAPVNDLVHLTPQAAQHARRQILFR